MKEIRKKIWPKYFERVLSGEKKFELRLADFEIEVGDMLILEEYDPKTKKYTGRSVKKKVNYLSKTKNIMEMYNKGNVDKYGFYVIQMEDVNG